MRIEGWHVDGFGILRDHEVRGLADGLTAFLGPNEAGKSTLLAFLRGVLVGYPSRGAAAHYPPLNGGEHGGRVFLRGPEGEITVERKVGSKQPRVVSPERVDHGDDVVRRLLGGVDAGLFNSVFAFSLTELQDLRSLTEEGVRDRIFSAGIAGAGRSARQAAARLEKEASELLRPRKGGLVNDLMDRLAEAESLAAAARAAAVRYPQLLQAELEAGARVQAARMEVRALRDGRRRYEVLRELWPVYYDGEEARRELESLGTVADLPDDPEERLATVLSAVAAASESVGELEGDAAEARLSLDSARGSLCVDLTPLLPRVEELADGLRLYQDRVASLPEEDASVAQASATAARLLTALGPGWDEDRLRGFDVSLPRLEEVREWAARLTAAETALHSLGRERDGLRGRHRDAEFERDRLRQRLEQEDPSEDERLPAEESALRRLRADAQEIQGLQARAENLDGLFADRERLLRAAEVAAAAGPTGRAALPLGVLAVGLAAAAVVVGWLVHPAWAGAFGSAAVLFAAAAYLVRRPGSPDARVRADVESLREAVEETRGGLASVRERTEAVARRMAEDAPSVGLVSPPAFADIEARVDELEHARDRRRAREELRTRLEEAEEQVLRAAAPAAQAESLLEEAETAAVDARGEWLAWKQGLGVPTGLGTDGVAEFLRTARSAQEALGIREDARARADRLRAGVEEWEAAARAVLIDAGRPSGQAGAALVVEVRRLREDCVADRAARHKCLDLEEDLEKIEARLSTAREALGRATEARDTLFREAAVEDEASFRAGITLLARRRRVEELVATARRAVDTRLGQGPDAADIRSELASGRIESWDAEAESLREALSKAEEEATSAIRLHRDAERSRQAQEESSDVAARELELGGLRTELDRALRRWQVVSAARALIEETLAEYSRTRQPPVLTEASAHLARVTGGAYAQIIESDDGEGFVVVDSCGGTKAPEHLSRGTLEQLYLSLRLGLVAEFARRAVSVPVIMDDVLVNFDPGRARATAEVLVSFAAEHQVLLFTCHPATVELLQKVEGGVKVVELGGEPGRQETLWTT